MKLARNATLALAAAGIVVATGVVGYAAIPGADGQVKACYATTNGLLGIAHSKGDTRIIDSAEACRAYEKAISWSQQGPKGDPGAPGMDGINGTDGIAGTDGTNGRDGVSGYEVVSRYVELTADGIRPDTFFTGVDCPMGKKAVGGGAGVSIIDAEFGAEPGDLIASFPRSGTLTAPSGWEVTLGKRDGSAFAPDEGVAGTVYVACVFAN